jgi:hypothetical protein
VVLAATTGTNAGLVITGSNGSFQLSTFMGEYINVVGTGL